MAIESIPARDFLEGLGARYREAETVLCISAH
jgi:hypothetical protein